MPASASADFFDVSSRSSRAHTQKNARQKRKYIKKEEDRDSNCIWRFSARVARKIRANDFLLLVLVAGSRSSPPRVLSAAKTKRCSARARVFCRKEKKGRQKIHTWEGRTRFLHRRSRRAIRAPPRTRGRRNRSSVRSQGSGRAFRIFLLLLLLFLRRRHNKTKCGETIFSFFREQSFFVIIF